MVLGLMFAPLKGLFTAPAGWNAVPIARATGTVALVDLSDSAAAANWVTVNDPVMGGRSISAVSFNGGLVFSGTISLENNGGFA